MMQTFRRVRTVFLMVFMACMMVLTHSHAVMAQSNTVASSTASVKFNKTSVKLVVGTDTVLQVNNPKRQNITWKTSDKKIVFLRKTSKTSAILMAGSKKGTATVSAIVGKKTLRCKITTVNWRYYSTNGTKLSVGSSTSLYSPDITLSEFQSTNTQIATVSKKGLVKAKKPGTCYIIFKAGRLSYKTQITVTKSLETASNTTAPKLRFYTWIYNNGGRYRFVDKYLEAGKTATFELKDDATGIFHNMGFMVNDSYITSGLTISSSNASVLSFIEMQDRTAVFYSLQDGTTLLRIVYKGYIYQVKVTISDKNNASYLQKREKIYQELGLNPSMSKQYICFLLATWICDHTIYSPDISVVSAGLNATYKDYFRYDNVVCAGYADLFMFLCAGLGIPCRQVDNTDMGHRWNQVRIDGNWYNIDTTWMDSGTTGEYQMQYFLISDAGMLSFSNERHLVSPGHNAYSSRFDSCVTEQMKLQNQYLGAQYPDLYARYSRFSPWLTGSWLYY